MVSLLGVVLLIGGAILLFDIGGIRTQLTINTLNPPAISSTSRILGFTPEGTITGTEIVKQDINAPQRILFQPSFNLGDFARNIDAENLKRAISEFGFRPK